MLARKNPWSSTWFSPAYQKTTDGVKIIKDAYARNSLSQYRSRQKYVYQELSGKMCLSIASRLQECIKIEGWQFEHFKVVNAQVEAIVINITCMVFFSLWTTVNFCQPLSSIFGQLESTVGYSFSYGGLVLKTRSARFTSHNHKKRESIFQVFC